MPPNSCWDEWCKALEVDIGSTEQPLAGNCLHKQLLLVEEEHRMIGILVVVVMVEHRMVGILVVEHRKIGILMAVGVEGGTTSTARVYR